MVGLSWILGSSSLFLSRFSWLFSVLSILFASLHFAAYLTQKPCILFRVLYVILGFLGLAIVLGFCVLFSLVSCKIGCFNFTVIFVFFFFFCYFCVDCSFSSMYSVIQRYMAHFSWSFPCFSSLAFFFCFHVLQLLFSLFFLF